MREWEINRALLREPLIDIGAGKLPLNIPGLEVVPWDKADGDATTMRNVEDGFYMTVYSHHCLEDLDNPILALQNWDRILARGGILYVTVPHRNLYEKRRTLPSRFNAAHKTMWLPDRADPPDTFSLYHTVRAACPQLEFISMRVVSSDYVDLPPDIHPQGDFHLEIVMRKP
jgi:SAM-dependent methyltransferase